MKQYIYIIAMMTLASALHIPAKAEDLTLGVDYSICSVPDGYGIAKLPFQLNPGSDVGGMTLTFEVGNFKMSPDEYSAYMVEGSTFPTEFLTLMQNMLFPNESEAYGSYRWTFVLKVLDKNLTARNCMTIPVFAPHDDTNWHDYGEGEFMDLFLAPGKLPASSPITVKIQQRDDQPGRFRIVNPYKNRSGIAEGNRTSGCKAHDHYIYINATDPDYVYIEEATTGLNFGNGEIITSSAVGAALNERGIKDIDNITIDIPSRVEAIKAANIPAGKMKNGEITFPPEALFFGETGHDNLSLQKGGEGRLLKITHSGIDTINADEETVFYSLDGVRVNNPAKGGIYIKRQGAEVYKVIL